MKTVLTIGLFFCATAYSTPAQDSRAASRPEFVDEFMKLDTEFFKALNDYRALHSDATTLGEGEKIKLDPAKDPQKLMHARYVDLGRRARGKPVGMLCLVRRMQGLADMEIDEAQTESCSILDELAADYLDFENLDEAVVTPFSFACSSPTDKLAAALSRIEKGAKYPAVRGGVMLLRASHLLDSPDAAKKADGRKLLLQVQKDYADTPAASRAEGKLYEADHLQIGMTPEDIVAKDETGKEFRLYDYRGRVTVVDFWGFWCSPCRAMIPHQKAMVGRLKNKPFALLGVNCDGDAETLKENLKHEGITWRQAVDGDTSGPWATLWNVRLWPTIYVLDHKGVIRYRDLRDEELEEKVLELVKEAEADAKKK